MNPDTWAGVTPAMETELTPMLDLLLRKVKRRDALTVDERRTLDAAAWLKRNLPVMAASRHSAGPILPGWATLQDVVARIGIPARTLTRWCETGKARAGFPIRAARTGRDWLVNEDDARKAAQHGHSDAEPDPRAAARSRRRGR
jgi:hypothetical protein